MSEAVTKTIVGTCEEVSERNGWTAFSVNVGSEYPVKLSTKVEKIIEQARAVGTDTATWTFKESDGKENPNRPGTFYKNRYLDKVELGDTTTDEPDTAGGTEPAPAPQRATEGTHAPMPIGDRERSIIRQTCLKAAGALFTGQGNKEVVDERDNVSELLAAADRMERWVMRDIDELPF